MNIDNEEMLDGFKETIRLFKEGQNIFDMGNHVLFPNLTTQQKWKYIQDNDTLHLSDGNHVYSFQGNPSTEEETSVTRTKGLPINDFNQSNLPKRTVQVHRADPGSIYFTLQEGFKNPTYTFRHVGGENWKAIPKKKVIKKTTTPVMIPDQHTEAVKQGMVLELLKQAGFGQDFNHFAGQMLTRGGNALQTGLMSPGRISPLAATGIGAGAGALYHLLRKGLYNSPEENEQEGPGTFLKRVLIPAAIGGGLSGLEHNMFDKPTNGGPGYYDEVRSGRTPQAFPTDGPVTNPLRSFFK
jgi:hypothetical protein